MGVTAPESHAVTRGDVRRHIYCSGKDSLQECAYAVGIVPQVLGVVSFSDFPSDLTHPRAEADCPVTPPPNFRDIPVGSNEFSRGAPTLLLFPALRPGLAERLGASCSVLASTRPPTSRKNLEKLEKKRVQNWY